MEAHKVVLLQEIHKYNADQTMQYTNKEEERRIGTPSRSKERSKEKSKTHEASMMVLSEYLQKC